ncbi:MAG: flavin reductase family protein, partial [Bacteroidota bacterium]
IPPDESEIIVAGFSLSQSAKVQVPRIAESPIHMECKLIQQITVGGNAVDLLLGEVIALHIREDVLQDGKIDSRKLRAIGRMGGNTYCRTVDQFEMLRPT